MEQQERIEQEADLLAKIVRRKLGAKPSLKLVNARNVRREIPTAPLPGVLQPFERDMRYQLIRDIARIHGIGWFLRKETVHVDCIIERLDDEGLVRLHDRMQKAQGCILEGVGFDDAGLM